MLAHSKGQEYGHDLVRWFCLKPLIARHQDVCQGCAVYFRFNKKCSLSKYACGFWQEAFVPTPWAPI